MGRRLKMSHSKLPIEPNVIETEDSDPRSSSILPQPLLVEAATDKSLSPSRRKIGWKWIAGIILLIGGVGLSVRWVQSTIAASGVSSSKSPAVSVKLETVTTNTVQDSAVFVGTLQAQKFVNIKPQIEGRVERIYIKEGDRVEQGDPIVSLQSDDTQALLQQRQAVKDQANANLALLNAGTRPEQIAQAQAILTQAQAKLNDAQAGAQPQQIAQAVAEIESAKATLDLAKARSKRYEQLAKQGAISQDQFEGYRQVERSDAAALVVAQRKLEQLRQSRGSDISSLAAVVEQQSQNLQQQQNGARPEEIAQAQAQVNQAAAQVRAAEVQLQYTEVLAPFSGVVGDIPFKVGELAAKGDTLTVLTKNDSFDLNLSIPLSRAKQLRSGLPVELIDATGKSIAMGRVSFIAPNATADSQTILAKATFTNSNGQLLNRQSVQAKVIWAKRPGILIPVTAVSRLGGKTFVFVAQEKQTPDGKIALTALQKPVELGAIEGNKYQVISGLESGEKIITTGLLSLTNGASISIAQEEPDRKS